MASAVLLDSPPDAGRRREDDDARTPPASPSGSCRTASRSCSSRRRSSEDEILFRATSPGGTSLASDADYIPGQHRRRSVVTAGGLGKFNAVDLRKVMTGKVASANPIIGELEEGLSGNSSRKDLETMFQLIYLRFTQPRADAGRVCRRSSRRSRRSWPTRRASPTFAFGEALNAALYQNHPRRQTTTPAMVDQWNLDKSMAFYKDRFADASDFTFVFVGSFDLADDASRSSSGISARCLRPTGRRAGRTSACTRRRRSSRRPSRRASSRRARWRSSFTGPFEYNQTQRVAIRAMSEILSTRLLETIREDLGGTYSINASYELHEDPAGPNTRSGSTSGATRSGPTISSSGVFEEIEKLKSDGPTDKQLADEKEALLKDFDTNTKQNALPARTRSGSSISTARTRRRSGRFRRTTGTSTRRQFSRPRRRT